MTDAEILLLVHKLEACQLAKTDFHHRDHLTVAVVYLMAGDLGSALTRMRDTLKRFAAHHEAGNLYHETLTRFWLMQVDQRIAKNACLADAVRKIHSELTDKALPAKHYSKQRLDSSQAREQWLPPDLG